MGDRITALRKDKGLKSHDLARLVGCSQSLVSSWENGKAIPPAYRLQALAKHLGASQTYIESGRETTGRPQTFFQKKYAKWYRPWPTTAAFAANFREEAYAVGGVLIGMEYPGLAASIDTGWLPTDFTVFLEPALPFAVDGELVATLPRYRDHSKKYSLVDHSHPFLDDRSPTLTVAETEWAKVLAAQDAITDNVPLRHRVSSLHPRHNKVPNVFALSLLVAFAGGEQAVLGLRRTSATPIAPGKFSLSIEEQLNEVDVRMPAELRLDFLFKRTVCEEVFPLAGPFALAPHPTWEQVEQFIRSFRVWGIGFEEPRANFSVFGFCQLNLTPAQYRKEFMKLRDAGGRTDKEGVLTIVPRTELVNIVRTGKGHARSMPIGLVPAHSCVS